MKYTPPITSIMWTCPSCGRGFKRQNQSHFCEVFDLERHLAGKPAGVVALYHLLAARVSELPDVEIVPMKSSILFRVETAFASATVRKRWVDVYFWLSHEVVSPRIRRVIRASAVRFVHGVRLSTLDEVDDELTEWLSEAHAVSHE